MVLPLREIHAILIGYVKVDMTYLLSLFLTDCSILFFNSHFTSKGTALSTDISLRSFPFICELFLFLFSCLVFDTKCSSVIFLHSSQ